MSVAYQLFLESLVPLVADDPAASTALRDYLAIRAEKCEPLTSSAERREHEWIELATKPSFAGAPKRARVTLEKAEKLFACSICGAISNRKYPYWFRTADDEWQMAKPPCAAAADVESAGAEG